MNEDFRTFLNEQDLLNGFPENLSKEHNLTPEQFEEVKRNQSIPDNNPLTGEPWNAGKPKANELPPPPAEVTIPMPPDYTPEEEEEIIDDETGEVTTITKSQPTLTPASKGYRAIVITMPDEEAETKAEVLKRAETNPALAEALKNGKKTWDGFFRFWHNKTADAHRAYNIGSGNALVVHREQVWNMAEEYFLNDAIRDINPAKVKSSKPKADKPKKEPKPKKETKVVPLTPQMGSLFGDEDFQ